MDDLLADLDGALGASDDNAPAEEKAEPAAEAEGSLPDTKDLLTDLDAAFGDIENKSASVDDPELKTEKSSEPTTDELIADLDGILTAPQSPVSLDVPETPAEDDALAGLDSIFEVEESEPIPGLSAPTAEAPAPSEAPAPAAADAPAPKPASSGDGLGDAVADELGSLLGDDEEEGDFKLESAAEAANGPSDGSGDGFLPETATMAEIYAGQGHYEQAIKIYRDKLERDPSDEHASRRVAELEALLNRNNPQE